MRTTRTKRLTDESALRAINDALQALRRRDPERALCDSLHACVYLGTMKMSFKSPDPFSWLLKEARRAVLAGDRARAREIISVATSVLSLVAIPEPSDQKRTRRAA